MIIGVGDTCNICVGDTCNNVTTIPVTYNDEIVLSACINVLIVSFVLDPIEQCVQFFLFRISSV